MRNDFKSDYLTHSGILGMKWGIRRYQNPDGSLTEEGRQHYGVGPAREKEGLVSSIKRKSAEKKTAKQRKAALDKARAAKAAKAKQEKLAKEYEENKQKVLKSGKASEVAKYKGQMSNQELSEALNRIRWEKELDKMSSSEIESGFDKIEKTMAKAKAVGNWANTAMDLYDTYATFYNWQHPESKMRYMKKGNEKKKKDKDDD
jgi:hypothetical protein